MPLSSQMCSHGLLRRHLSTTKNTSEIQTKPERGGMGWELSDLLSGEHDLPSLCKANPSRHSQRYDPGTSMQISPQSCPGKRSHRPSSPEGKVSNDCTRISNRINCMTSYSRFAVGVVAGGSVAIILALSLQHSLNVSAHV